MEKPPQSLHIAAFNVHGFSTNVEMNDEISKVFLGHKCWMCVLTGRQRLMGKDEVLFGEVIGSVCGIGG